MRKIRSSNNWWSWGQLNHNTNIFLGMSRKSHGSPLIADYLTNWTSSFFLEGESDSQFLDVGDVNVFTGIKVDICHDASWYQKKTQKKLFFELYPMVQSASCYDAQEWRHIGFLCCIPKESYCINYWYELLINY